MTAAAPIDIPADDLNALLDEHVSPSRDDIGDSATASAIQLAVGTADDVLYSESFGVADPESPNPEPVNSQTPFDIASTTKALVGATLAMQAVDERRIDWHTPIDEVLPAWNRHRADSAPVPTLLQLLNHTSGLPDWHPFFDDHPVDPTPAGAADAYDAIIEHIASMELAGPPGTTHTYSDPGYILLSRILEELFDAGLADLAQRRIFAPLRLPNTGYAGTRRDPSPVDGAVVTENCPHRQRVVRGTVHDTNTNVIGGVSTHAGVFSTAGDLLQFARHLLAIDAGTEPDTEPIVSQNSLRFAWSDDAGSDVGHHRAGWDTPSGNRSSAGRGVASNHTVGHLGFTGTSIWIERNRGIAIVLLTNRVYPTRDNDRIKDLRIAVHETILPPT